MKRLFLWELGLTVLTSHLFWRSMMRKTPKSSICLVAFSLSCVGLMFVFSDSVWTQETKAVNARVKELEQQRLTILEELCDTAKKLFQNARVSYEVVLASELELLTARLASADTQNDRIKICDDAVEETVKMLARVKVMKAGAQGTRLNELKVQAYLLEIQITREKIAAEK